MQSGQPDRSTFDLVGLQLYAYDVLDEGADRVVELAARAETGVLLLLASYCDADVELSPGRGGELQHNPRRQIHLPEANLEARRPYPQGLDPSRVGPEGSDGGSAIDELREASAGRMTLVPWVTLLTQRVAYESLSHCVVNARGDPIPGWLCPSRADTKEFVRTLVADLLDRSQASAIFIDRIRFPEWGPHGLVDFCTCFCESCQSVARDSRIDLELARVQVLEFVDEFEAAPSTAATNVRRALSSGVRSLAALGARRAVLDWFRLRQAIVGELVRVAQAEAAEHRAEVWLDVWPPSYGWLLGQDLRDLGSAGAWTKPFTYHRWGGGADIAGFIAKAGADVQEQQALYDAFLAVFGFPGPERFADFRKQGLRPSFITDETAFAADLLGGRSKLAAGLQLWHMTPAGVREGLEYAARACPDGVFFHCYGWATESELEAAGEWLREARSMDLVRTS